MSPPHDDPLPERIGRYRIRRLLGRGGMGAVFEAEQENPRRTVALKIVATGIFGEELRRRFELEAQVLAHLQHPCIAQVYEAGVHEGPGGAQPYFAMELIRGVELEDYVRENDLDLRTRLALLARICDGVQHAHQRGVVHRDLKPGNILVDDQGRPKILDFGLARATDADIQAATMHTEAGRVLGTIPYMSPEQAGGDPSALDARSDVYSLGVVGYELLSGTLPYDVPNDIVLGLRAVREDEPRPLSSLNRSLRGDVDTIIGKALQKEPERRYASAAALAEDIRRFLNDEPINARRPSAAYQLRKFARRNKALVGGVIAVFVALVAGLVGTGRGYLAARAEAQSARETAAFFRSILEGVSPAVAQGEDTKLLGKILDDTAARIGTSFAGDPLVAASVEGTLGEAYAAIARYEDALAHISAARDTYVAVKGADSEEVLVKDRNLGAVLVQLKRTEEAIERLESVVSRASVALGPEHAVTYDARNELGVAYLDARRYDDAAGEFEPVLAYRRRTLGPDDERTLISINCLGLVRIWERRYEEAEKLLREALEGRRRVCGETHPETIKAVHNLGGLYAQQARFTEAEALYREALERDRRILGDDHAVTLNAASNLAGVLARLNRLDEALELRSETFATTLALHGPVDMRSLDAEHNLAVLLRDAGRVDESYEHDEHVAATCEEMGADGRSLLLDAWTNMATILGRRGETERCWELRYKLIEAHEAYYGPDAPETLMVESDAAVQLLQEARDEEAAELAARVLEARRRVLGSKDYATQQTVYILGSAYRALGRNAEAVALFGEFLATWPTMVGDDDPYAARSADFLTKSLGALDDLAPHAAAARTLVEFRERTVDLDDPAFVEAIALLERAGG